MTLWFSTQMPTKSYPPAPPLFRLDEASPCNTVTVRFHDQPITAPAGTSVAAALLMSGVAPFRETPVSSAPRAPYCMMGVCFECLVEIDGIPNRQACLVPVRDGMVVRRQHGAAALPLAPCTATEGEGHER